MLEHLPFRINILLFLLFFSISAKENIGEKYAIIVGISKYKNLPNLSYPENDAKYFAKILTRYGDFFEENIHCLIGEKATRDQIKNTIINLKTKPQDILVFYFAGHGTQVIENSSSNDEYDHYDETICPYDFQKDTASTHLTDDDLFYNFEKVQAKRIVIVLDCCHSVGDKIQEQKKGFSESLGEEVTSPGVNARIVLAASSKNGVATKHSEYSHGAFTYFLGQAILGDGDSNSDGKISIWEAFAFADKKVIENSRVNQNPQIYFSDSTLYNNIFFSKRNFLESFNSPAYAKVLFRDKNLLSIDLGSIHGLKENIGSLDTLLIVKDNFNLTDGNVDFLGKAVIFKVFQDSSLAKIIEEIPEKKISKGDKCVFLALSGFIRLESEPAGSELNIISVPANVNPSFGGIASGTTPIELYYSPLGEWVFSLKKSGHYNSPSIKIKTSPLKIITDTTSLKQKPGSIEITSIPSNINVKLDGDLKGNTPYLSGDTPPGTHIIVLSDARRSEYDSLSAVIQVQEGKPFKKTYELPEVSVSSRIDYLLYRLLLDQVDFNINTRIFVHPFRSKDHSIKAYGISSDIKNAFLFCINKRNMFSIEDENDEHDFEIKGDVEEIGNEFQINLELFNSDAPNPRNTSHIYINKRLFERDRSIILQHSLSLLPGVGRLYANENVEKGLFFIGGTIATVGIYILGQERKNHYRRKAESAYSDYLYETNSNLVSQLYKDHKKYIKNANQFQKVSIAAAILYGGMVLHEFLWSLCNADKYHDRKNYLSSPQKIGYKVNKERIELALQFSF